VGAPEPPALPALTSLRFFAALHVVLFHMGQYFWRGAPWPLAPVLAHGFVGVSFFFVLSGFILGYVYGPRVRSGDFRQGAFWRARVARIYPLYLAGLVLALPNFLAPSPAALASTPHAGPLAALTVPTLTQAWLPAHALAWNPPAWSLSVEAVFYLTFPWLAVRLLAARPRRPALLLGLLWACSWVPGVLGAAAGPAFSPTSTWWVFLLHSPLMHLAQFLLGVQAAAWRGEATPSRTSLLRLQGACLAAIVAGLVLLPPSDAFNVALNNGLLAPAFAGLFASLSFGPLGIGRWLGGGLLVLLGDASYGIYLFHQAIYPVSQALWRLAVGHYALFSWPTFAFYLALLLAYSIAMHLLLERPAQAWIRGRRGATAKAGR
jgi:peptidoglycan/LPS O-acetylase OafA/YrhL